MLFDPKWEVQTKPDVFSLESLIAWLEKQPADRQYDYCLPGTCLVAQYLSANGVEDSTLSSEDLDRLGWHDIAQDEDGLPQDWTFGGALCRARKALGK